MVRGRDDLLLIIVEKNLFKQFFNSRQGCLETNKFVSSLFSIYMFIDINI